MLLLFAALLNLLVPVQTASQPAKIKFEPTDGVPTFAVRDPILKVKPGTIVEIVVAARSITTSGAVLYKLDERR